MFVPAEYEEIEVPWPVGLASPDRPGMSITLDPWGLAVYLPDMSAGRWLVAPLDGSAPREGPVRGHPEEGWFDPHRDTLWSRSGRPAMLEELDPVSLSVVQAVDLPGEPREAFSDPVTGWLDVLVENPPTLLFYDPWAGVVRRETRLSARPVGMVAARSSPRLWVFLEDRTVGTYDATSGDLAKGLPDLPVPPRKVWAPSRAPGPWILETREGDLWRWDPQDPRSVRLGRVPTGIRGALSWSRSEVMALVTETTLEWWRVREDPTYAGSTPLPERDCGVAAHPLRREILLACPRPWRILRWIYPEESQAV